jgi:7,8-dihydropterin-6-yl-methyl-4-(beta-D-ribofuranosyl)aminobenzene 5'-phosphate synthase
MERRTFIKVLLLGSGGFILGPQNLISASVGPKTIKVLMIYNNIGRFNNFESAWGVSIWIENKDTAVLFDTGGNTSILWNNIKNSGIDIKKLSKIIISHKHWDHIDGLPIILEKTNYKPDVLVPIFDLELIRSKNPKTNLIGIKEPIHINDFLWSTGQMKGSTGSTFFGDIHEQSLIVIQDDSIYLLTGCSHPGIVEIVEKAKKIHPNKILKLIIGGFHLLRKSSQQVKDISTKLKSLQVSKVAPSHCTGELAIDIFKNEWKENYIDFNIGNSMKI